MSYESAGRSRYQIVIALGEGTEGARRRTLIERAAKRDGYESKSLKRRLNLSAWARDVLLAKAGEERDA